MLFPGCVPVCNRRLVTFERTVNKQGRCHPPTKHLWAATVKTNNWKLGVSLYVKGKPLNSAYLWGWQFLVKLVISEVTATCWLVNYRRIQFLQVFPATFLLKSTLLKQEGKSLIFCCGSFCYMLSPPFRFLPQRAQSLLQLFMLFLIRWCILLLQWYCLTVGCAVFSLNRMLKSLTQSCFLSSWTTFQVHNDDKPLLLLEAEKLISMCKQLQITAKASAQGKSATFTKVR